MTQKDWIRIRNTDENNLDVLVILKKLVIYYSGNTQNSIEVEPCNYSFPTFPLLYSITLAV